MLTQTSPHSHVKTHKTKEGCLLQVGSEDKEEAAEGKFALCLCWNAIFHHSQTSISKYISYILTFIVVIGFVASTLPELEMLVQMACSHEGRPFHDLLYAMPICYTEFPIIYRIKEHFMRWVGREGVIHVLVDSDDQLDRLEDFVAEFGSTMMNATKWSVFLKLDTGYHRAGVTCDSEGVALATRIINSSHCSLRGLYSHW